MKSFFWGEVWGRVSSVGWGVGAFLGGVRGCGVLGDLRYAVE